MEETHVIVLTTVGTKQFAADLARSIVEAGMAACVQMQPVQSVYRWKGKVRTEPEWQLAIKTIASGYTDLERHIRAHHSYEMPEIVKLPITGGSAEYLAWISGCVS